MSKTYFTLLALLAAFFTACSSDDDDAKGGDHEAGQAQEGLTVPADQYAADAVSPEDVASKELGGIHFNLTLEGVTQIVLESVDGYQIAGDLNGDKQSIINFWASEGGSLTPGADYYIVTFPCDLYGGYRLTFYKDGQKADYYGVHQVVEAGSFITPADLDCSELEFADLDAPFVEDERPELNDATASALAAYQNNPTQENKDALLDQMGVRYDKVVARKKAKLRELERDAHDQALIDEMLVIVNEMVDNREIRLEQQFYRLIDPRDDDDPNDEWMVLRGADANNAYIAYAPLRNSEYAAFKSDYAYAQGQDDYPAVNVSYADALAYCQWLGEGDDTHEYRLPTEVEWILAAGHMPKDVVMNSDNVEDGLTAVDAYAQTTGACGGIDFWGNCWEWTSTINAAGEYVVKGGSWDSSRDACRSEYSDDVRDGSKGYDNVGFRVVRVDR